MGHRVLLIMLKIIYLMESLLLVSEDGANLLARSTPIAFSVTGKTWINNHAHVLRFSNENLQKFVEIYLNSISLEWHMLQGSAAAKAESENVEWYSNPSCG